MTFTKGRGNFTAMEFVSFGFYVFLAIIVAIYYITSLKSRWIILLTGSLGFYWLISDFSKKKILMLIFVSFICWMSGKLIKRTKKARKAILIVTIVITTIPLLAIKEAPFIFNKMASTTLLASQLIVPVGISFFSLQLISYIVDVYNEKVDPQNNFLKFLLFTSFFPQILQGPIPRYNQLSHQLVNGNRFSEKTFVKGFMLILWGFFLKLCIADKAGVIVNQVFDNYPTYCGVYVLLAGILYSFQLYADFLSCTTLARGISALFGIELVNNFNHPYFSESIKEFWRRWHISLSFWLRDYIYIPLGGNRKGKLRKYVNLILTFAVSGIWHGSGIKFLLWGLIHGIYQVMGEILGPVMRVFDAKLGLNRHICLKRGLKTVGTFLLVMFAWIIFRAESLTTGLSMIKSIFTVHNPWILTNDALFGLGLSWKECAVLMLTLMLLLAVGIVQEKGISIKERVLQCCLPIRWCIYIGTILLIIVFGTYGFGFDAQAFIYGGF